MLTVFDQAKALYCLVKLNDGVLYRLEVEVGEAEFEIDEPDLTTAKSAYMHCVGIDIVTERRRYDLAMGLIVPARSRDIVTHHFLASRSEARKFLEEKIGVSARKLESACCSLPVSEVSPQTIIAGAAVSLCRVLVRERKAILLPRPVRGESETKLLFLAHHGKDLMHVFPLGFISLGDVSLDAVWSVLGVVYEEALRTISQVSKRLYEALIEVARGV